MSYDLGVFAPLSLSSGELRSLVESTDGLGIEEQVTGSAHVVRGARRRYSFTIDGPDEIDREDVPGGITRVVRSQGWAGCPLLGSVLVHVVDLPR